MEADSYLIAKVFSNGGDIHFRLPYFQREYAWTEENWRTLWNDILDLNKLYNPDKMPEHFMGSLVVMNEGTDGTTPIFKIVDGQQRLISISLILRAIAETIDVTDHSLSQKILKYVTNPDEHHDLHYKILPTSKYDDKFAYTSVIDGKIDQKYANSSIVKAYNYFLSEIEKELNTVGASAEHLFLTVINGLQVVFINLNAQEKPYQIFESLNAKGKPLSQADLVRNYIAMKLPEKLQTNVFDDVWSKIEILLQEKRVVGKSRLGELTAFLRHYLAYSSGVICNENHVYARFRDKCENEFKSTESFVEELNKIKRFAVYYDRLLHPENEPDNEVRKNLQTLKVFEVSTGYPLLLAMYDSYSNRAIDRTQFIQGLKIYENYIIRRYINGDPTNYLNRALPTIWKEINTDAYIETLTSELLKRNYPSNFRIKQSIKTRQLYDNNLGTRNKTTFLLEQVNVFISKKLNRDAFTKLSGKPTIEHIMPQTLTQQWINDLGDNYHQVYDQYLNNLGNLTLVTSEWNTSLSNAPFSEKKEKLSNHGLLLNDLYFNNDFSIWGDKEILDRADFLLGYLLELWPEIGELPKPQVARKPVKLSLLGQEFDVKTWRDVAIQTTESIIGLSDTFEEIGSSFPSYLSKSRHFRVYHQLSNGWFLKLNLSSASIKYYCQQIIKKVGLTINEWKVEEI